MNPFVFSPESKARFVAGGFSLVGVAAWAALAPGSLGLPLALFYAAITVNTYFSVRFFVSLKAPEGVLQHAADLLVAFSYIALALSFSSPRAFVFFALCLFVLATAKYVLLLNVFPHPVVLKRKILIDLLGVGWTTVILGGLLAGYGTEPLLWIYSLGFAGANFYLLVLKPMYRL